MTLPPDIRLEAAPDGATLSQMLADGAIDGIISPRAPSVHGGRGDGRLAVRRSDRSRQGLLPPPVFPDHASGGREARTGRAASLAAGDGPEGVRGGTKAMAAAHLADTSATKVMLPFVEERLAEARALDGGWTSGRMAWRPTGTCWTLSCAITTTRACRNAWSAPTSCSIRRRTKRSGSEAQNPKLLSPGWSSGPAAERPVVLAVGLRDREVVDAGEAPLHQALRVELPVLVAVGAEPVAVVVVLLVGEAHGDAVVSARPQLLDQAVVELLRPFAPQERPHLLAAD